MWHVQVPHLFCIGCVLNYSRTDLMLYFDKINCPIGAFFYYEKGIKSVLYGRTMYMDISATCKTKHFVSNHTGMHLRCPFIRTNIIAIRECTLVTRKGGRHFSIQGLEKMDIQHKTLLLTTNIPSPRGTTDLPILLHSKLW